MCFFQKLGNKTSMFFSIEISLHFSVTNKSLFMKTKRAQLFLCSKDHQGPLAVSCLCLIPTWETQLVEKKIKFPTELPTS